MRGTERPAMKMPGMRADHVFGERGEADDERPDLERPPKRPIVRIVGERQHRGPEQHRVLERLERLAHDRPECSAVARAQQRRADHEREAEPDEPHRPRAERREAGPAQRECDQHPDDARFDAA